MPELLKRNNMDSQERTAGRPRQLSADPHDVMTCKTHHCQIPYFGSMVEILIERRV